MRGILGFAESLIARAEWVMGLDQGEILGNSRSEDVSLARASVAWVLSTELGVSKMRIGKILRVDHTSVISQVRAFEKREKSGDWDASDLGDELIEMVKEERLRMVLER